MVRSKMETTFYDEDNGLLQRVTCSNGMNSLKRPLTLDLNLNHEKRVKLSSAPMLSSPDLNMLKLGSPELEKFIISQNGLATTTPTPSTAQILFPPSVTEEQEIYAKGFVDALHELQASDSSQMSTGSTLLDLPITGGGNTYTNLEPHTSFSSAGYSLLSGSSSIVVKEEPHLALSESSSPPMSPIDMENQERIKLERKRQRNRIAASKCRRRKLERISRLEDKVKILKGENAELGTVVHKLKEQVCLLKEQVMEHVQSGCEMPPVMMSSHFTL